MNEIWRDINTTSADEVRVDFQQSDSQQLPDTVQQKLFQVGRDIRGRFRKKSMESPSSVEKLKEFHESPTYKEEVERKAEAIISPEIDKEKSKPENVMFNEIRHILKNAGIQDEKTFEKIVAVSKYHMHKISEYELEKARNNSTISQKKNN